MMILENPEQALAEGRELPFAYLKYMSHQYLGRTPRNVSLEELAQARFFGPDCEIRIYDDGEGLAAVKIADGEDDVVIDTERQLSRSWGYSVTRRQYLEFDEDGQGRICCTRLMAWKGV